MADPNPRLAAVRTSHDRFSTLVRPLSAAEVEHPSYASEWSVAQTASHLGSQAEIFALLLEAGLTGGAGPGREAFGPIWDRWNALSPVEQVRESLAANEAFVTRLEQTSPAERERFSVSIFGTEADLAELAAIRLGEHALHTWDIAVALDPRATVAADAVDLLIDRLGQTAARSGKPAEGARPVPISTVEPERTFVLTLDPEISLQPTDQPGEQPLVLPAEALVRLVNGRLDPDHTPTAVVDDRIPGLRTAFPGF